MSEEIETLMTLAALGQLDAEGQARWDALCAKQPELRAELEALQGTASGLSGLIEAAEQTAAADLPEELPPHVLARLEEGRLEVFHRELTSESAESQNVARRRNGSKPALLAQFITWITEATSVPAPALAATAAVVVALTGWWIWQGQDSGGQTVIATLKDPVVSADLSILSPGDETSILDPTLMWMTFDPQPAEASVLTSDGETLLFTLKEAVGKAPWAQMTATDLAEAPMLEPGETYIVRVRQGAVISERIVRVRQDAKPLDSWLSDRDAGVAQARQWLERGAPGDAIVLAAALAGATKGPSDEELVQIRTEARNAAMKAAQAEAKAAESSGN